MKRLGRAEDIKDYNNLTTIGYSSHDAESWFECPVCKRQYHSWGFFHEGINSGDVFQCECGEKLLYR